MNNESKKWIVHVEYITGEFQGLCGEFETYYEYENVEHFESNVFRNEGYVILLNKVEEPFIVNSKYINYAYEKQGE